MNDVPPEMKEIGRQMEDIQTGIEKKLRPLIREQFL